MNFKKAAFIFIVLLFVFTRIYELGSNPPSLYWDEASIGYNAYSVLKTGKDEWGKMFPVHFRAFGEFKLPVYIYTVAGFEAILGLNSWAVRLPAVFFSLGTLIALYFLVKKISNYRIAIYSSFILVISPWFFIFSRTGYEASAGLMFYIIGVYLFVLALKKSILLIPATFCFVASIYSYNSFRVEIPLTLISLVFLLIKNWKFNKKLFFSILISFFIFVLSTIPILRVFVLDNGANRFNTVSIIQKDNLLQTIKDFGFNYTKHFSPDFLFINGDNNLRSQQLGFGEIYWLQLPFLFLGLIYIYKRKSLVLYLIPILLLLGPIPAAITRESPHALRAISTIPFISILTGFGVFYFSEFIKQRKVFNAIFFSTFLILFIFYFYSFVNFYPKLSSQQWQYGYKELFGSYAKTFDNYDHVLVSDYMAQPYIFSLFYQKKDPVKFLGSVKYNTVDKWGFSTVNGYDNILFEPININNLPNGNLLIFASPKEDLKGIIDKGQIKNLDDSLAFRVYEYEKK